MSFSSFEFAVFFLVVFTVYVGTSRQLRAQNLVLLIASYVFYGWWDWRFLGLIALSSIVDFVAGQAIHRSSGRQRALWLLFSLTTNLGLLGVFKYFDFFADSFANVLNTIGFRADAFTLGLVLPVGISFYTFQTLSYSIDIYRGKLKPVTSLLDFAVFVSFFPQLVAGPIERASAFLPQVRQPRTVTSSGLQAGLFLIVLGYLKKTVIADNLATIVDQVYGNHTDHGVPDLLIATIAFSLQIYGDFSGYSDIARGLSKTMGFELRENFRLPYFATNPSDFWRRWHISLSSWLRDYVYIPLGGNRGGAFATCRNLMLTMLIGGLWHGAAWNFILWGFFHGAILVIYRLFQGTGREQKTPTATSHLILFPRWLLMMTLTLFGWMLFRAESLGQIQEFCMSNDWSLSPRSKKWVLQCVLYSSPLLFLETVQQFSGNMLCFLRWQPWALGLLIGSLLAFIFVFASRTSTEFIYFQF
ncbi:MAG: MBOAT family protein [Planctomycetota bacterium]